MGLPIPSFTTRGESYLVEPTPRGPHCACPAWRAARPCKHVRVYLAVQAAVLRCAAAHHTTDGHVCQTCVAALLVAAARKVQRQYKPKPPRRKANG